MPFSSRSFQPRYRTQVSHVAGGFFTIWVTGEAAPFLFFFFFFFTEVAANLMKFTVSHKEQTSP